MATVERKSPIRSGPLSKSEAAALIEMILANTTTSAPSRPVVPDSPRSLADYFPLDVLQAA